MSVRARVGATGSRSCSRPRGRIDDSLALALAHADANESMTVSPSTSASRSSGGADRAYGVAVGGQVRVSASMRACCVLSRSGANEPAFLVSQ
jgi:hypothetical protein